MSSHRHEVRASGGSKQHAQLRDGPVRARPLWVYDEEDWRIMRDTPSGGLVCPVDDCRSGFQVPQENRHGTRFLKDLPGRSCPHTLALPQADGGGPMSAQHRWLQARLARVCESIGYAAITEHYETHADVYVPDGQLVIEVQRWSTDFQKRTSARLARGDQVVWFITEDARGRATTNALFSLPAARLEVRDRSSRRVRLRPWAGDNAADAILMVVATVPQFKDGRWRGRPLGADIFLKQVLTGVRCWYPPGTEGLRHPHAGAWVLPGDLQAAREAARRPVTVAPEPHPSVSAEACPAPATPAPVAPPLQEQDDPPPSSSTTSRQPCAPMSVLWRNPGAQAGYSGPVDDTVALNANQIVAQRWRARSPESNGDTLRSMLEAAWDRLDLSAPQILLPDQHDDSAPVQSQWGELSEPRWIPTRQVVFGGGDAGGWGRFSYRPDSAPDHAMWIIEQPADLMRQPLEGNRFVTPFGDLYSITFDGRHRMAAAKALGLPYVPLRIEEVVRVAGTVETLVGAPPPLTWTGRVLRRILGRASTVSNDDEIALHEVSWWLHLLSTGRLNGELRRIDTTETGMIARLDIHASSPQPWLLDSMSRLGDAISFAFPDADAPRSAHLPGAPRLTYEELLDLIPRGNAAGATTD